MSRYRVTFYFVDEYEVEADNEDKAVALAYKMCRQHFYPIVDEQEIECLDGDTENEEA